LTGDVGRDRGDAGRALLFVYSLCWNLYSLRQNLASSRRTPGSIRRGFCVEARKRMPLSLNNMILWLWIPAFAGTTRGLANAQKNPARPSARRINSTHAPSA
jgi:hypothetical protein